MVVAFVLLLCGAFLMWRIPLLPEGKQVRDTDSKCSSQVSIIVPMRNEEHSIPTLLKSLQGQLGPVRELIAVDDGSADNGAALAQQFGAIVVQVPAVPQGWTGKSWACWTGAVQSSGELLLFLDADTFLEPGGLQRILAAYRNKAGLVTVQPFHVTVKAYEQLSAIFNIVSMAGVNAFTLLGDMLRPHGAFGPCMICSREDYFSTGGHAAVRNKVLEDLALAALFSRNGHSVSCYGGRGAINFRMYPQGLFQLIEGWSKNISAGALSIRCWITGLIVAWVTGALGAFVRAVGLLFPSTAAAGGCWLAICCLYALEIRWILRRIGRFRWWAWALYPLPMLFFCAIVLYSLFSVVIIGRVRWKGRIVKTG